MSKKALKNVKLHHQSLTSKKEIIQEHLLITIVTN